MSDLTFTKTMVNQSGHFYNYTHDFYSCNFIAFDDLDQLNISKPIQYATKSIFFYPSWLQQDLQHPSVNEFAISLRNGYEVSYTYNRTMEIYHWMIFSNQVISLNPYNISVPDEVRDLHGYKIVMYATKQNREVMTFDAYLLELIASKRNATAVQETKWSNRISVLVVPNPKDMQDHDIISGPGSTYIAILTHRAKPKSIVAILVEPFDIYTWATFLLLVLTIAITFSLFGEVLGTRHFSEIVLELIMISLSGPSRPYGGSLENRIITIFCVMGIVLISSYQSLVISFMSYVRYHQEINTLEDITHNCVFKESVEVLHLSLKTFDLNNLPSLDQNCYIDYVRDNEAMSIAMYEKFVNDSDRVRARVQELRHAKVKFYEYPLCYYVGTLIIRNFFSFYVQAIIESGIYDFYYRNKSQTKWQYKQDKFINRTVKLQNLTLLWYAYGVGSVMGLICFIAEIFFKKISTRESYK
ncbi:uncharacterized protein LOC126565974 [Anopheles maculipalpis]|uniref:uncharacterized protein LOC126565974 n=1 Tax=Anopheles maculipalpis TaxID=1496333 RepID=UPI00215995A3|nr:uncharacterized protein LOC126565974 [Anopheles maculipalpis]